GDCTRAVLRALDTLIRARPVTLLWRLKNSPAIGWGAPLRQLLLVPTIEHPQPERPSMPQSQGTRFAADRLTFIVRHQLWDGNVQDHVDQGVSIDVAAEVGGKETTLLRFNCFDIERSYIYGPDNAELSTPDRVGGGMGVHCRMDPVVDGNPIGWAIRVLGQKLPKM